MKAPLYSKQGNKKKDVVLNPSIYGVRVNERLLSLVKRAYAANLRRGTASTKVRKEVRGGGRKPWRQKGTGRARQGSIRAPHWKGGGVVFGPHPRDYSVSLSRAVRLKALISALSLRASEKNIFVLEDAGMQTAKTKEWIELMDVMPIKEKRALCVVREIDENLKRASHNARNWVEVRKVNDVNAYHVLQREKLMIEQDALPILEERLLVEVEEDAKKKKKEPSHEA